ncbi:MAG: DUF222 domain-containing protein, partial [Actinomycetota bacterium]
ATLLAEVGAAGLHRDDGFSSVRSWVQHRYRLSNAEVARRLREVRAVAIAEVGAAYEGGEVSGCAVRELGRAASNPRCGDRLVEVIEPLLEVAREQRHVDLRTVVRQWERLADADGTAPDPEVLHERRTWRLRQDLDGAFHLTARFGNVQGLVAEELMDRFHAAELEADLDAARSDDAGNGLPRTAGQRHADAFIAALTAASSAPADGRAPEPLVNVTIDQTTFEHHLLDAWADEPPEPLDPAGFLDRVSRSRHGSWVDPRTMPALALIGHVRRVVLDGAGVTIDLGRRQRLFTGAAREAVLASRTRCAAPGCDIPAHRCEIDHVTPWDAGGRTDQRNAAPLCGRHHRAKDRARPPPVAGAA